MNDNDYTVLVVDDEKAVLSLMATHLADLPYTIISTSSPIEAIKILKTHDVAVLLCDLNLKMPDINGNTILAVARESNADIVSILISGISDQDSMIQAINEGGIWKFLAKPWKKDEFIALVEAAVNHYARIDEQNSQLKSLARSITQLHADQVNVPKNHHKCTNTKALPAMEKEFLFEPGSILANRYKLGEAIGEGGSGQVFKAQDLMLKMTVAVKVLFPEFSHDEDAIFTLKEEARIAMQLSHKHIVRLHNLQEVNGCYYLIMEYVEGKTFRDILELSGRLTMDSVAQIIRVSSDALAYAHRHGVIHKDLKPDNILLTNDGVLKLIDFGIACMTNTQDNSNPIMGTPSYMSPEHIRGDTLDARTDIYALGIIAYEFLSGKQPFPANMPLLEILDMMPPKLDSEVIPDDVAAVLEKATAFRRANRWESVPAFATSLIDAINAVEQKKAT